MTTISKWYGHPLFKSEIIINSLTLSLLMARPIQPTPILEGEDAERLLKEIATATFSEKKQKFLDECREIYAQTK